MAIKTQHSMQFLLEQHQKEHNTISDTLIIVLVEHPFEFNPHTHSTYGDISALELPTLGGYIQKDKVLSYLNYAIDVQSDDLIIKYSDAEWIGEAGCGDLPLVGGAVIINASHINDTIVLGITLSNAYQFVEGQPLGFGFGQGLVISRANELEG